MIHDTITLGHGSGGSLMHALIKKHLASKLDNPYLRKLGDSALIAGKGRLAFTTDSFVVKPLYFPGGDIGKLAVCGTVNDLLMSGAEPEYLSLGLIVEEGLALSELDRIVASIQSSALSAKVKIVAGDFKVVERKACDKIFINTSGIGKVITENNLAVENIRAGDAVILTGAIAAHGLAVLAARNELKLGMSLKSDCAALNKLLVPVLRNSSCIKCMRDPTRGGLATTLNELAGGARVCINIDERETPVNNNVRAASELLGIDPLYVANEGVAVMIVESRSAKKIISKLRRDPLGRQARIIGGVTRVPAGRVIMRTVVGTERIIDMLASDPLPRIC